MKSYHGDMRLQRWRGFFTRAVHYVFDLLTAGFYWYCRKRGEYPPPLTRSSLRWVFGLN